MISEKIYSLLIKIKEKVDNYENNYPPNKEKLIKYNFIERYHYTREGNNYFAWKLTDTALNEIEEYERVNRKEIREEKALKESKKANIISIIAIIISVFAILISLLKN